MTVDERPDRWRQLLVGEIETAHNFPRDIFRGILGPMFGGVVSDDPDRVAVLAGHQVGRGGFEIGLGDVGHANAVPSFPKLLTTR